MNYIQNIFKKENTGKVLSDIRYVNSAMSLNLISLKQIPNVEVHYSDSLL